MVEEDPEEHMPRCLSRLFIDDGWLVATYYLLLFKFSALRIHCSLESVKKVIIMQSCDFYKTSD